MHPALDAMLGGSERTGLEAITLLATSQRAGPLLDLSVLVLALYVQYALALWREEGEALRRVRKWGSNSDISVGSVISISGISNYLGCAVGYTVFFGCYALFWDPESRIPI